MEHLKITKHLADVRQISKLPTGTISADVDSPPGYTLRFVEPEESVELGSDETETWELSTYHDGKRVGKILPYFDAERIAEFMGQCVTREASE